MISSLSGTVLAKQDRTAIVEVGGVGYLVYLTRNFLEKLAPGQEVQLFIHTNVREDDISLYGFPSSEEWGFFRLLLTVSGVGPKSALEILNVELSKARRAISQRDVAFLTLIPGIGKKTAERIIVDLQGKMKEEILEESAGSPLEAKEEIVQALVSLGYHRNHVVQGLKKVPAEVSGEEAIIKYFLQNI